MQVVVVVLALELELLVQQVLVAAVLEKWHTLEQVIQEQLILAVAEAVFTMILALLMAVTAVLVSLSYDTQSKMQLEILMLNWYNKLTTNKGK